MRLRKGHNFSSQVLHKDENFFFQNLVMLYIKKAKFYAECKNMNLQYLSDKMHKKKVFGEERYLKNYVLVLF
jgi:hypothetical protein